MTFVEPVAPPTVVEIADVTCKNCKMLGTLSEERLCEFCRPRKVEVSFEPAWLDFEKEDLYVLAFAIAVLGALLYFAPFAAR